MKKLNEIIDTDIDAEIKGIKSNSRKVEKGDLFLCTSGVNADRHEYIDDAISRGAVAAIISKDVGEKNIPLIKVKSVDEIEAELFQKFYDHPEEKLEVITVGGTDGKTTTASMIQTLLGDDICGYIGTNGYSCSSFEEETDNTTPGPDELYEIFNKFVNAGCKYVVVETSSEAFYRNRLHNLSFDVAAFTNITLEHLNVHKTYENYLENKLKQFEHVKKDGLSVLNKDDKEYETFKSKVVSKLVTYGKEETNNLCVKDYKTYKEHLDIHYIFEGKDYNVKLPLVGAYNIYNLSAALLVVSNYIPFENAIKKVGEIKVKGRSEIFTKNGIDIILDYAHTPNGVESFLKALGESGYNKIYTIIGQAGRRDASKRKTVGKIVCDNSDVVIFTMEDPRDEDFDNIIKDMAELVEDDDYITIYERRDALRKAFEMAEEGDAICILGKGRESGNLVNGSSVPGSDYDYIMEIINEA